MLRKRNLLIATTALGLAILFIIGALTNNTKMGTRLKEDSTMNRAELKKTYTANALGDQSSTAVDVEYNKSKKENDVVKTNRKIILTGNMDIETNTFDNAIKAISLKVTQEGGYIEGSQITGVKSSNGNYLEDRTASYTIRIPSDKFESFMNQIGNIGVVTNKSSGGEDVTAEYIDTTARLKSQKIKEARLIEILKKAQKLTDVMAIETELENTRYEIETLTGNLKQWDNLVTYSTLTINLIEVAKSKKLIQKPDTMSGRISNAFDNSITLIADMSKGLVVAFVAGIPFIIILSIIFIIAFFITKRIRNRFHHE